MVKLTAICCVLSLALVIESTFAAVERPAESTKPSSSGNEEAISDLFDMNRARAFCRQLAYIDSFEEGARYKKMTPFMDEGIRFKKSPFENEGVRFKKSPFENEGVRFKKSPFENEGVRFKKSPFENEGVRFKKMSQFGDEGIRF